MRRRLPTSAKRGYRRKQISKARNKNALVKKVDLKTALRFAGLVFIFTVFLVGYSLFSQTVWKGSERITLVLQELEPSSSSGVYVVSYLSSDHSLAVVSFPVGMKVQAVGGFGSWRVESLYPLGEMEGGGGELLKRSLADFFGVKIDGWMVSSSLSGEVDESSVRSLLKKTIGKGMFGSGETNLGLWDLVRFWKAIGTVRLNDIEWVDLENVGAVAQQTLVDGSTAFVADSELLDKLSKSLFSQTEIMEEGLSIAVLNATYHQGLGAGVARIIRNMGGDVVAVSDSLHSQEDSTIIVSDEQLLESIAVKIFAKTLLINNLLKGETSQQRADILVVVGEDYWTRLNKL